MSDTSPYEMTVDLNVLNHLGIKLYSSIPAVLSEAVANAWDADAEMVAIEVSQDCIIITDDGHGMTTADINAKFLKVGYQRRKDGNARTARGRDVLGRKGIGKLSLFSVADTIEVHSCKNGKVSGLILSLPKIQESIESQSDVYFPEPVSAQNVSISQGTRIEIRDIRKNTSLTPPALRRRLARRFSSIGRTIEGMKFEVAVNGQEVTVEDREFYRKVEYLWTYGDLGEEMASLAKSKKKHFPRNIDSKVSGWIGTVAAAGDLLSEDGDNLNDIQIMVRGKVAQERTLEKFGEDGLYARYVVGEIHADWLDADDEDDVATSSRQFLIEDDPRVKALMTSIQGELKHIQNQWTELRTRKGVQAALRVPEVSEWFGTLGRDQQSKAKQLFGKINSLKLDPTEKRPLFKYGVLAFERLKLRDSLSRLDHLSDGDIAGYLAAYENHDDLEAQLYYEISKGRLEVIESFQGLVDDNALESNLQKFLFDHLWLLDPSWDRATSDPSMEREIKKNVLNDEEFDGDYMKEIGRADIQYRKSGGKHVIIELKRAGVATETIKLLTQVQKYQRKLKQLLVHTGRADEEYEIICIVGKNLV
ncbi:MAG: ATP-binding protein, partial [Rhodospirillaceae bacterium]|nr:ATP-binding protein [Rhodospirillaceae bacterium]